MKLRYAKRLYNEDQVTDKKTSEVGRVIGEPEIHGRHGSRPPFVIIQVLFERGGYQRVTHLEID